LLEQAWGVAKVGISPVQRKLAESRPPPEADPRGPWPEANAQGGTVIARGTQQRARTHGRGAMVQGFWVYNYY